MSSAFPQYSGNVSQFTDILAFPTGPSYQTLIVVFADRPSEVEHAFSNSVDNIAAFHFEIEDPGAIQVDALSEGVEIAILAQTSLETLDPPSWRISFRWCRGTGSRWGICWP